MEGRGKAWKEETTPTGEIQSTQNTLNIVTSLYTVFSVRFFLPRVGSMETEDPNLITSTVAQGMEQLLLLPRVWKKKKSNENCNPR